MLEGSILKSLRDAHQPENLAGKRSLDFGVYYKNTLVALCHALEDAILGQDYSPLMITAFQRGKWYLEEADRYMDLAERSRQVVIMAAADSGFAEHPTSQRDNVALVEIEPADAVAQEWHLIVVSPQYTAMVLCQELSEEDYGTAGVPTADLERKFYGLWTFEPSLVVETATLAIAHVQRYNPALSHVLTDHLDAISGQIQQQEAQGGLPTADHLGDIVSRVVDYLQHGEQRLTHSPQEHSGLASVGLDYNLVSNELQAFLRIAQLIDQTDLSNPMAAAEVASLAESLGQLLDLPAWQLHRLRLAGLLHRIAQLQGAAMEITPGVSRYGDDDTIAPSCPLVPGTQILRTMNRLKAIATILNHQAEWWNGMGYPAGLAGDEIPLESRILGLVSCFQQHLAAGRRSNPDAALDFAPSMLDSLASTSATTLTQALSACQAQEGERWDPKLVEALALLVNGLQQGLSLSIAVPKIAAGMWMLDSHAEDDLLSNTFSADARQTDPSKAGSSTP